MKSSVSQNNDVTSERTTSLRVLWYGIWVQLAGVTATLLGFIGLKEAGLSSYKSSWPIGIAYAIAFFSMARAGRWLTRIKSPKATDALWHIFLFFIFMDTILLAALVYVTGGANVSIFTPVFLLIPTVAASYCSHIKLWFIVVINLVIYGFLLFVGNNTVTLTDEQINVIENWVGALTALCILAAALSHTLMNWIRHDVCVAENSTKICSNLYL